MYFSLHHNQRASDYKDFTFVKFIFQLFSSSDESLKNEIRLLLLFRWFASDAAHIVFIYTYNNTYYSYVPMHT